MKKYLMLSFFYIFTTSTVSAFDWSINDYIENCSVVHQKKIANADLEIVGYCMRVLKGTLGGIIATRSIERGKFKIPMCLFNNGNMKFWEVQKNVLAEMRLNFKNKESASQPNTANVAVASTLIKLYPCLLD